MNVTNKAGEQTGQFGSWLTERLQDHPEYRVYYDHGDPARQGNVAVISAFLGDGVTRDNKLAEVDVLIANPEGEILLLIEIEENPLSPKTLLGDVFGTLLSSGFTVRIGGDHLNFRVSQQTQLWVAGFVTGWNAEKIFVIDQIREFIKGLVRNNEEFQIREVKLVVDQDLNSCLESLRTMVLNYWGGRL